MEQRVVVYASFGLVAEPQVMGVASSAQRAEVLAERVCRGGPLRVAKAGLAGVGQRPPRASAVNGCGNAVEVWLVEVGLDDLIRFVVETESLVEEGE